MTIGTLGRKIVFEVSDETALILQEMTRETSGRWPSMKPWEQSQRRSF